MIRVLAPSITTLRQAALMASASHLNLITRNGKTVLSPTVPAGWAKVGGGNPPAKETKDA